MIDAGYKKIEIYNRAHELGVQIHLMTLKHPKFEMYEEGSHICRSSKSVSSNIVEGYCLRKHKKEFLLYPGRSYASASETIEHLAYIFETSSLKDEASYQNLRNEYESLSKMIFVFAQKVAEEHTQPHYLKEPDSQYNDSSDDNEL